MKFKPLLSVAILLAAALLTFSADAKKKANKNKSKKTVEQVAVESPVFIDTVKKRVPVAPDVNLSFSRAAQSDSVLRVAIVLADMSGNRDAEFLRGFLLGVQNIDVPEDALSLKVINGQIPADSLNSVLAEFNPNTILSTHEKDTPKVLLDYAQGNYVKFVSVFDAKSDDYKNYPGVYQLLAPSTYFNAETAKYLMNNYADNILLIVNDPEENDQIAWDMIQICPQDQLDFVTSADFPKYNFEEGVNYIIYPTLKADSELTPFITEVQKKIKANPLTGIRVVGRPNWVALKDLEQKVNGVEVLVPAKCYFDPLADASKRFIKDYNAEYGKPPIRSYPVYAVMGSDAARYFIPAVLGEIRGTKGEWTPEDLVQSYFNFGDEGWGQGAFNKGTYILHYSPGKKLKKDLVN